MMIYNVNVIKLIIKIYVIMQIKIHVYKIKIYVLIIKDNVKKNNVKIYKHLNVMVK